MSGPQRYAVIGDPVGHSLSPAMHNAALAALGLDARYEAVHVRPEELGEFVARARRDLAGFNATVPHKEALIPLLDEVASAAMAAGSVNTVSCRNGRLMGDSTDGYGLEVAIREAFGIDLSGRRFVFLGAGGTARAAVPHFLRQGAAGVAVVNRTVAKAAALLTKFATDFPGAELRAIAPSDHDAVREAVSAAAVVVQATSLGLKDDDPCPLAAELFLPGVGYFDTIYRDTAFLAAAQARGCRCADGLGMLLHQGAASFRIWTGCEAPVEVMRQALAAARRRPGSFHS
jgi:shikimate dehydrogenase